MRLLFDANLSPSLVRRLKDLFPNSSHVFDTDLARFTPDETIWNYARQNGFVIVTADSDFVRLAEERGARPKVVWLENCNYRTVVVEEVLRRNAVRITELADSPRTILIIRSAT